MSKHILYIFHHHILLNKMILAYMSHYYILRNIQLLYHLTIDLNYNLNIQQDPKESKFLQKCKTEDFNRIAFALITSVKFSKLMLCRG